MEDNSQATLEFDEDRQVMAKEYQRRAIVLTLLGLALFSLAAFAALPSALSLRLESWALSFSGSPWIVVALYVTPAYLLLTLLALPLRIIGRRSDLRFKLTKQSWHSWALDRLKSAAFGLLFTLVLAEALYWSIRGFGSLWWLVFWGLATAFAIATGYLAPVILLPLFYKVRKVENASLVERLHELAGRAGIRALGVYEFDSSAKTERGTAGLAGLGATRRILLSDHILRNYSAREVEGILAHELGHHMQRDTAIYLLLTASLSLLALFLSDIFVRSTAPLFGISSISQVSTLPLFALFTVAFYTATGPLTRYVSRKREARADMIGAKLCGDPASLASALVKLHDQNLADATPHPLIEALFYTHPAGRRRVRALLSHTIP
ncbi:MAG: M48 family metalloprotease [Thermoplasmata archaeon]